MFPSTNRPKPSTLSYAETRNNLPQNPDNILPSANMLAPKCPGKIRHDACNILPCKQMSATRSTVREMQLLKMQDAESL